MYNVCTSAAPPHTSTRPWRTESRLDSNTRHVPTQRSDSSEIIYENGVKKDTSGSVAYLKINSFHLEDKSAEEMLTWSTKMSTSVAPRAVTPSYEGKIVHAAPRAVEDVTGNSRHAILNVSGTGRDITEQFHDIMRKIRGERTSTTMQIRKMTSSERLERQHMSLLDIYYVYVYIKDMRNFAEMNAVYKTHFNHVNPPSRYDTTHPKCQTDICQSVCQSTPAGGLLRQFRRHVDTRKGVGIEKWKDAARSERICVGTGLYRPLFAGQIRKSE